jgi:chromosome segregation and condensation protein ScpB
MPALIGVMEFVEETTADYKSPITSTFVSRMNNMKQTISTLEEVSLVTLSGRVG